MVVVKSTTVVVERDAKAMRRCGLITVLMLDHDPHELAMVVVNLPQLLSDC